MRASRVAFGCKKQEEKSGIVTLAIGTVTVDRPGAGPAALQIKDRIAENDTVITGAMSLAVVQFSDNCVVQVQERLNDSRSSRQVKTTATSLSRTDRS